MGIPYMKCDNPGDDYYWQNSLMNDKYMYMYTKTVLQYFVMLGAHDWERKVT